MLNVLLVASPAAGQSSVMVSVLEALVARGHHVVFVGERSTRDRVERIGGVFADDGRPDDEPAPVNWSSSGRRQVTPALRRRFIEPLHRQWSVVQELIVSERIDIIVCDPEYVGAMAVAVLPSTQRPAVMALGTYPLPHFDPLVAPYGLALKPWTTGWSRVRNLLLFALMEGLVLRPISTELRAAIERVTGHRVRGRVTDPTVHVDAWAQLTVTAFEYPRVRQNAKVRFVGPLRPAESGTLPAWWDYEDPRPVVHVHHEDRDPLEALVIPAIDGLQDEELLLVVTGTTEEEVAARLGRRVPANTRIGTAVSPSHLLSTAAVAITTGDYVRTQYALRWAVPVVVTGSTEEQAETAARVEWLGVGTRVRTARGSSDAIRAAVLKTLGDGTSERASVRLASQIARTDAERALCELAEELVASSQVRSHGE